MQAFDFSTFTTDQLAQLAAGPGPLAHQADQELARRSTAGDPGPGPATATAQDLLASSLWGALSDQQRAALTATAAAHQSIQDAAAKASAAADAVKVAQDAAIGVTEAIQAAEVAAAPVIANLPPAAAAAVQQAQQAAAQAAQSVQAANTASATAAQAQQTAVTDALAAASAATAVVQAVVPAQVARDAGVTSVVQAVPTAGTPFVDAPAEAPLPPTGPAGVTPAEPATAVDVPVVTSSAQPSDPQTGAAPAS